MTPTLTIGITFQITHRIPKLRLIAISALILAGCQLATSTPTALPTRATATMAPSHTPPATATLLPSPLPSPSPTASLQSSTCPRRVESSAVAEHPTGYLILGSRDEQFIQRLFRLNLQDGTLEPFLLDLPRGYVEATITSPDGRWLAFVYAESDESRVIGESLIVASADATKVHAIPLVEQLQYIRLANWTSDGQRIVAYPSFDENTLPHRRPDKIVLIDPFTEKWELIQPVFSYTADDLWDYWRGLGGSVAYDPTITRVVYLDDDSTWVLYDLENSRELWRAHLSLLNVWYPVWDKAGDLFAFSDFVQDASGARQAGFVTVSREGGVVRNAPLVTVESSLPFYGLSPDGRYIWFEVLDGPSGPGDYIWDRETSTLIDCFKDDSIINPVWSPDGRYFIYQATSTTGEPTPLLAVDLQANIYFELGLTEEFPKAWLSADK